MEQIFAILLSLHRGTSDNSDWVIGCLAGAWPKLLGDRLAAVCRPAAFRKPELVIELTDKTWEEAVTSIKPELLEKLRVVTSGLIQSISVRTTPQD